MSLDRTVPPAPGPLRAFDFPPVSRHALETGLPVEVVQVPHLPVVTAVLVLPAGEAVLSEDRAGQAVLAGHDVVDRHDVRMLEAAGDPRLAQQPGDPFLFLFEGGGDAGPGDAAVVMDFFRYRRQVTEAARVLANAGTAIVAITDSPLSPLVELTDNWCEIEVPAIGPFDSSVPIVAACELLVARVAEDLKEDATNRIDRIEALWDSFEAFL